ncbi:YwqJ-related putative deaminase [Streptomyces barkulensis]|uniref:YwqJ-related putative deaminase n=1 Tax=Streptomyces barkulensis TaxID=1257026 RepID=UPI000C6ED12E|nr:YwqJ-related putative deaminase [Streptomyces barkulensis]
MSDGVPGVAASLLIRGTVVSQTNLTGDGRPELHPAVREFFDALPPEHWEPFIGYCAESALVSDQLWRLDQERTDGRTATLDEARPHFEESAIMCRKIREQGDPEHGQPTPPCRSCTALLERLSVRILSA